MAKEIYTIISPDKGLNVDTASPFLETSQTPALSNVYFNRNAIVQLPGRTAFGPDTDLGNAVVHVTTLKKIDGTEHLIVTTLTKTWRYNATISTWVDLDSVTDWSGDGDDLFSSCIALDANAGAPLGDIIILHNGKDKIRYWDVPATATTLQLPGDSQNYDPVKIVRWFKDRLWLLGTYEGGAWQEQRIRFSDIGDVQTFSAAHFVDLMETPGRMVAAEELGPALIIYKEDGIVSVNHVGGENPFTFPVIVEGLGALSAHCVTRVRGLHYFLGTDYNVYQYDGTYEPKAVGDVIRDHLKSHITPETENRAFSFPVENLQWYCLCVPETRSYPNALYIYDYRHSTWTYAPFPSDSGLAITSAGVFKSESYTAWEDLPVDKAWSDYPIGFTWDDFGHEKGQRQIIMGDDTGKVSVFDMSNVNDRTAAIEGSFTTKEIIPHQDYLRNYKTYYEVFFEARGDNLLVEYSTNGGSTWTTLGTQTMTDSFTEYRMPCIITARRFQLRFSNPTVSETWQLRACGVNFEIRGEW